MADRIWAGTRVLAQQHLDAGQRVWLVTATPVELASIIAHRLGLTGALGTVAEVVDGHYTGRLVGELMHGEAKDRKSTRLNSSHANISYAVFCLKKKKNIDTNSKFHMQTIHILN